MNESLFRDFHDAQIEEIAAVKAAIAALPIATPADIAKLQLMIANIKLPTQDSSELKRYFYDTITTATSYTKTQLAEMGSIVKVGNNNLANSYNSINNRLEELVRMQSDPKPKTTIHRFDFSSLRVILGTLAFAILSLGLGLYAYGLRVENSRLRANDLKYRYIKMVGNINDSFVAEVDEYVLNDKSGKVLAHIEERVTAYEKIVADKIRAEEQARLRASEAAELDAKIKELQQK